MIFEATCGTISELGLVKSSSEFSPLASPHATQSTSSEDYPKGVVPARPSSDVLQEQALELWQLTSRFGILLLSSWVFGDRGIDLGADGLSRSGGNDWGGYRLGPLVWKMVCEKSRICRENAHDRSIRIRQHCQMSTVSFIPSHAGRRKCRRI